MVVYIEDQVNVQSKSAVRREALTIEVVRGTSRLFTALEPEWNTLQQEMPCQSPFTSPVWLRHWVEVFAPDATVLLILARHNGELRGVLPLLEQRIGGVLTLVKSPTNYYSGRFDIVHGTGDFAEVTQEIWNTLRTQVSWDLLDIRDVAEGAQLQTLMRLARLDRMNVAPRAAQRSPYVMLDDVPDFDKFGPYRNMKRRRRQLEEMHEITSFRVTPITTEIIDIFLEMESAGWKGAGGTSIETDKAGLEFHRRVLTEESPLFRSVAHEMLADGKPIALSLGFETETVFYAHKRTYDETYRKFGPGHLITQDILRRMHDRGLRVFDMMGSDEPYKMEWTDTVCAHSHYLVFRNGFRGSMLFRAAKAYETRKPQLDTLRARLSTRLRNLRSRGQSADVSGQH